MKRVAITGWGAISPLGHDWPTVLSALRAERNVVRQIPEWSDYEGLNTRLGVPAAPFELPPEYNRKSTRSMGRVALMATRSGQMALQMAGLQDSELRASGDMGIAYGSSAGTPSAIGDFGRMLAKRSVDGINANTYIKMMSHTTAVNMGVFLGLQGRIITTSSACTSGSQGIGYAYEAIKYGRQVAMLAGGAEELDVTEVAVFDTLYATSVKNDAPELTPRPFDSERDGLVIGEGAGTLVLENFEHAQARGAPILAELVGFGTNSDGKHITQPTAETMARAMRLALEDAGLPPEAIGYINAHGTATTHGDVAESQATRRVFDSRIPISSLKSYMGHTLGACGALEAWMSIAMMREGWFAPTINLRNVDPACAELDYIGTGGRFADFEHVMSNNFAFGGINTSLIFRRVD
jgi:3-oxoacyl-[acyl-carrier-protein] synthase II